MCSSRSICACFIRSIIVFCWLVSDASKPGRSRRQFSHRSPASACISHTVHLRRGGMRLTGATLANMSTPVRLRVAVVIMVPASCFIARCEYTASAHSSIVINLIFHSQSHPRVKYSDSKIFHRLHIRAANQRDLSHMARYASFRIRTWPQ
jgi:hypothetical protein